MSFNIFEHTTRPESGLLFHRDESGDPRLGEIVRWQHEDYAAARFVLLGCPQDDGVRRNGGRVGAAAAPDAIRMWLYRLVAPEGVQLFDLGNTIIQATLEETHAVQQQLVHQLISDGKTVISLGGGNDLSYPDCAALGQHYSDVMAFNVDAHLDVREHPTRHSGTPYRMLLDEGRVHPRNFYEVGYQPFAVAASHLHYLADKGASTRSLNELRSEGIVKTFQRILTRHNKALFWGIDMDVIHISEAPGVSAPNPLGMSGDELCSIMRIAGKDKRTRIVEFTEMNPTYDLDHRTCRLAAVAIWHFLSEAL